MTCQRHLVLIVFHNISVAPKIVKKVITNLDLSKTSSPDCIPVVVVKNFEPELSFILTELKECLKDSCFPDSWKASLVVPIFKNVGERSTAKSYHPVSLLSVVSKVIENLVIIGLLITQRNVAFFLIFDMVLSSRSTADLLTTVSDRIARAFNRSGTTPA